MLTFATNFWLIQAVGLIALVFVFFAWNAKERKNIFALQSVNLVFFTLHYWLLSALVGAAMCLVVLVRNFVFVQKGKQPWANHYAWPYVFAVLAAGTLIIFWNGWITLLPVLAVVVSTYAMWQDRPAEIRWFMLISCILWVPYVVVVQSWSGLLGQAVGLAGILVGMYRHDRNRPVL